MARFSNQNSLKQAAARLKQVQDSIPKPPKDFKTTLSVGVAAFILPPAITFNMKVEANFKLNFKEMTEDLNIEIKRIMPYAAKALKERLDQALETPVWGWTQGNRDIIDTGALRDSGQVVVTSQGLVVSYSSPYASIVHEGGYIHPYGNLNARPVYLPGRPWVRSVIEGGGPVPQWNLATWLEANARSLIG